MTSWYSNRSPPFVSSCTASSCKPNKGHSSYQASIWMRSQSCGELFELPPYNWADSRYHPAVEKMESRNVPIPPARTLPGVPEWREAEAGRRFPFRLLASPKVWTLGWMSSVLHLVCHRSPLVRDGKGLGIAVGGSLRQILRVLGQ